jgi:hypothetical protein
MILYYFVFSGLISTKSLQALSVALLEVKSGSIEQKPSESVQW